MIPATRYAREIEAAWTELLERPVVLGERDWALICDWHARGIPMALIHEAMEALGEKLPRRKRAPRNLGALAPGVEEAWAAVRAGRVSRTDGAATPSSPSEDPLDAWRRCAASRPDDESLRSWLEELVEQLDAGGERAACEDALSSGLLEQLPQAEIATLTHQVQAELAPFRDRMKPQTWEATLHKALLSAARRRLGLPRLDGPGSPA